MGSRKWIVNASGEATLGMKSRKYDGWKIRSSGCWWLLWSLQQQWEYNIWENDGIMGMWHMAAMVYFAKVVWWPLWSDMKWHMTLSLGLVDTCQIQLKSMFTYTKIVTAIDHVWLVVWNIFSNLIIGNHDPNWLIFFRGVETTNQIWSCNGCST